MIYGVIVLYEWLSSINYVLLITSWFVDSPGHVCLSYIPLGIYVINTYVADYASSFWQFKQCGVDGTIIAWSIFTKRPHSSPGRVSYGVSFGNSDCHFCTASATTAMYAMDHIQWETLLLCNDISHWLGSNLGSALCIIRVSDLGLISM